MDCPSNEVCSIPVPSEKRGLEREQTLTDIPSPDGSEPSLKGPQKAIILSICCSALFFDIFNSGSTIIALPTIQADLGFSSGELQWVFTAYTLTFAAFLLSAGRLSDIYHPKPVFCVGYLTVGVFSVLCGVSVHPIMLLIFRAVQGIGGAMTIPSAVAMIVQNFPEPNEQGRALALLGGFGGIGQVAGLILGGLLTARVNWRWSFYLVAIVVIPVSGLAVLLLPKRPFQRETGRKLDWQGVVALSGGLILFVYAISDANETGWAKPQILITLIFSVIFVVAFFVIERYVKDPAVPPRTWTNENFLPLFFYTWSVYWNAQCMAILLVQVFQDLFHWSALSAAIHSLPIGLVGLFVAPLTGIFAPYIPRRLLLIVSQTLTMVAMILFALGNTSGKYWTHIFPGTVIGTFGIALAFVGSNIAIMAGARKGEEGVVGAMMNTGFQLGATVGVAVCTAIVVGVNKDQSPDALSQFKGYAAAFWSLLGLNVLQIFMIIFFIK